MAPFRRRSGLVVALLVTIIIGNSAEAFAACGDRGGPGYRKPNGQCASWKELCAVCGNPPETRCAAERVRPDARTRCGPSPSPPPAVPTPQRQGALIGRASVIDGDTIEIHGQRVRLWGIDAPEGGQLCCIDAKRWPCGRRAAFALSDHIGQQTVACEQRDVDRYNRPVAVCSISSGDLSAWLVENGWALDWPRFSGGAYAAQQQAASVARRGIWQGRFDNPWDWRAGLRRACQ